MFIRIKAVLLAAALLICLGGCRSEGNVQVAGDAAEQMPVSADICPDGLLDHAAAAVVYCCDTDEVLYGHDLYQPRAIASITKIMTAVVALDYIQEQGDPAVQITPAMYAEGSSMYLREGEILRLSELVKGMMAVSGNDAANAVALTVAGSQEQFAVLMNDKAAEIGMRQSHFVTPSGLDNEAHYATAYDMAKLCDYAMQKKAFAAIVSQREVSVAYLSPSDKVQLLHNHNKLLSLCDGCMGIKTGFTKKAGRTLTSCCERSGVRLVVVTLNDGDDWNDHQKLYDYGFSLVERVTLCDTDRRIQTAVVGDASGQTELMPQQTLTAVLRKNRDSEPEEVIYAPHFIYAPVVKGRTYGRIVYRMNGKEIASCRLVGSE